MTAESITAGGVWSDVGLLALNAGSSSLKFAVFSAQGETALATGQADRIGPEGTLKIKDAAGHPIEPAQGALTSHDTALATVIATLKRAFPDLKIAAVGHRVVHGGIHYTAPVVVDENVLQTLSTLSSFAPLH
ncbi:MAG: hypothetical protein B7Z14_03990, partial [Bosea sp. 32-68-6]